ncbi:MAG TPA: radical SAM protein [Thermoleophilia bacterium]|nr:radical SAM protein [Thermoleophilia bacterium]
MTTAPFEQGPLRPPSEAHSLLVRVIRNCTWNRCTFCPVYKGAKSSLRPEEEVLADVDAMAAAAEVLRRRGVAAVHEGLVPAEAYQVSLFLGGGARTVFLQDADPCAVKPAKLAAIVQRVRERFPTVDRVTTYGRASTLARRTPQDLALLVGAGLTRVHLGLESGADEVLMAIDKGCSGGDLIEAGEKVVRAGLELCFYLMPGLGGREAAAAHVAGSARVISAVAAAAPAERPLVVRLRTAAVVPGTPLAERAAAGEFVLPDDVEVARELRDLLEQLGNARLELRSDHMLNLLPELEGSLPRDRERLVAVLDEYLGWPREEQARFAVGARLGIYRRLADQGDPARAAALDRQFEGYRAPDADELLRAATALRARFI